jgi:hypothetical protein
MTPPLLSPLNFSIGVVIQKELFVHKGEISYQSLSISLGMFQELLVVALNVMSNFCSFGFDPRNVH